MVSPFGKAVPEKLNELLVKCLLVEQYKHKYIKSNYLERLCPLGIYVTIDETNFLQWNGTIFIKDGIYQNLMTTFKLIIPQTYPTINPTVFFSPGIYHPLINQGSGELDIKVCWYFIIYT